MLRGPDALGGMDSGCVIYRTFPNFIYFYDQILYFIRFLLFFSKKNEFVDLYPPDVSFIRSPLWISCIGVVLVDGCRAIPSSSPSL